MLPLSIAEPCHQDPVLEGGMAYVEKGEGGSRKLWIIPSSVKWRLLLSGKAVVQ